MTPWRVALVLLASAACGGAQGGGDSVGDNPAVVVHPTAETRTAVAQAVTRVLSHAPVSVDDDALATTGVVIAERSALKQAAQMQAGEAPHEPDRSERFHIVLRGERCYLVHDRTFSYYELPGTTCTPR